MMSNSTQIGAVHVKFSADDGSFKASVEETAESVRAVGKAAESSAAIYKDSTEKMTAATRVQQAAFDRAYRAFVREEEARRVAEGRASQAAAAAKDLAHAQDLAALKADILARSEQKVGEAAEEATGPIERLALIARERFGDLGEKMSEVAERAELSSDGIASAFGGISSLFGLGMAGAFIAHSLDDLAELNVELGDIHEKTGIAVQDLAGLRLIAQSKGLDFTTISMGLTRLGRAMFEAKEGMLEDREAFSSLGISMQEVNTDSVEQMFYRISKAIGENRSLVLSDGTALELFGRGGKELIPIMQQYGGDLETVVKQQAALTGITDQSVAASQQWLIATSDLSAEFHSHLVPLLEWIVEILPLISAGMRALSSGVAWSLGQLDAAFIGILNFRRHEKAIQEDLANHQYGFAKAEYKDAWSDFVNAFRAQKSIAENEWSDAKKDYAEFGTPNREDEYGQNNPAHIDGALLKDSKEQLAEMERRHPLNRAQIIAYWKRVLAKAPYGSQDYDEVNLLLGTMMEKAALSGLSGGRKSRRKISPDDAAIAGMRQAWSAVRAEKPMTLRQQEQWWIGQAQMAGSTPKAFQYAVTQAQHLLADMQHKMNTLAGWMQVGDWKNLLAHKVLNLDPSTVLGSDSDDSKWMPELTKSAQFTANQMSKMATELEPLQEELAVAKVKMALSNGHITQLDAALAIAAIHQQAYNRKMQDYTNQISAIEHAAPGSMSYDDQLRELNRIKLEKAQYQDEALATAQQDMMDTGRWEPESTLVAVHNALDGFVLAVRDTSGQITDIVTDTVNGLNRSLSESIMERSENGNEWRANVQRAVSDEFRRAGASVLDMAMGHVEGGLLSRLGFGPKTKRGDSAAAPLYVHEVGAKDSPAHHVMNVLGVKSHSVLGEVSGAFQGFFADGGDVRAGLAAIVGERGPEVFVPHTAGTIIPNHALGGKVEHHYHIDARGAHDPAAVEAAVHRGMQQVINMTPRIALEAVVDYTRRTPSNSRKF